MSGVGETLAKTEYLVPETPDLDYSVLKPGNKEYSPELFEKIEKLWSNDEGIKEFSIYKKIAKDTHTPDNRYCLSAARIMQNMVKICRELQNPESFKKFEKNNPELVGYALNLGSIGHSEYSYVESALGFEGAHTCYTFGHAISYETVG